MAESKSGSSVFTTLQTMGRSFMLPIALLPIAGLMLGLGAAYPRIVEVATALPGEGSAVWKFFAIMSDCGVIVFQNLSILFAIAVAMAFAKAQKEIAAFSAVVGYLAMYASMTAILHQFYGLGGGDAVEAAKAAFENTYGKGLISDHLGFSNTMNLSVFGGIAIGSIVSWLHNKFYKVNFPEALSFFSGTRFVPIISAVGGIVLGFVFSYIWPYFAAFIAGLGQGIAGLGAFGPFVYAYIYRALIPLGLHHVFYLPFWQTALGGAADVAGHAVYGAQNILFERLSAGVPVFSPVLDAAGNVTGLNPGSYFSGFFPMMVFTYPVLAYVMYKHAKPEKKGAVKGLLVGAAFTSFLTGITEPLEFSFLFAAPFLYFGVICVMFGITSFLANILNFGVGFSFSGGAIDFVLLGIIPGNEMTHWVRIVPVGIACAAFAYFVFDWYITQFNVKTPGREDEEGVQLITKAEYLKRQQEKKEAGGKPAAGEGAGKVSSEDEKSEMILEGLGGVSNVVSLDSCATRLRVGVKDSSIVDEGILKATGSRGFVKTESGVQVIYGGVVANIKTNLDEYIEKNGITLGE
ncbi:MAG: PTS transporter subunit EIIC [Synergistaceae bacterium]|nr:PTS transporter subunit EIIC [Synergistaceae bacterium]